MVVSGRVGGGWRRVRWVCEAMVVEWRVCGLVVL